MQQIFKAKVLGLSKYFFENQTIKIRHTCNFFITMNQIYVGRVPLPENLKALFRPVAMILPDYYRILEVSLYSLGFDYPSELAKKIESTFMLVTQLCSSQPHYDFGLRAHKAVLDSARLKKLFMNSKFQFVLDLSQEEQIIS
jgi:dynein heavy chain